jgi:pimeloyl-ACP methyl ester carboxylesterase
MIDWESHFRVIAINYPAIADMQSAVRAISNILAKEAVGPAYLLGTSLGGEIAQAFIRERPREFAKVVLGNTGEANAEYGKKLKRQAPITRLFYTDVGFSLIKFAAKRRVMSLLAPYVSKGELGFWKEYMTEIVDRQYSTKLMRSQFNLLQDFAAKYADSSWTASDPKIFIIESDDDAMFTRERRERLKMLYSSARVKTFKRGGHLLPVTQKADYVKEVTAFLLAG